MADLHGRVALVTGSSSGIGAAIATTFAQEGATVVVNSASSIEVGEQLAAEQTWSWTLIEVWPRTHA